MYKVLLVDDEELDLEGMHQFIPWSELEMEVKGSVNNALSACELLEQFPIDILISDVNMPYMSGLELARAALLKYPDIRIIFVSGYQEFSYVQQALSLKAYNYVLKPMHDNELVASLQKVKQDLDEARKRREVEEAYRTMIPLAKSDLLQRLFEGDEEGALAALLKHPASSHGLNKLHWPVRVAVMELDGMGMGMEAYDEAGLSQQEITRMFLQLLHESVQLNGNPLFCKLYGHRIALLLEDHRAKSSLESICAAMNGRLPVTVTTGLGQPVNDLKELHASYRQAVSAVEGKMFLGKGGIIIYEQVSYEPEMIDARMLNTRMDALLQAMQEYDLVQIYDELDNLFQTVTTVRSKFTVQNWTNYIFWNLEQRLSKMDVDLFQLLGIELHNLEILLKFETINDIRSWLVHRVFEISEHLYEKSNSKNGKFIRGIIAAMKERMGENMTLKDIAQLFSFSPSYLGYLIKEKSGFTFNELLVQLRMERACELLKQPGVKIYEVADQVGYRYLPYFSRQFKEKFGMTPLEYRNKEQ
ncbi:response regulator [Paenibacillus sp. NPDC058071]|uniref:response regulator n=1 Tax=Paenibacillus sp. NPDC058071 TaxID=3346326 RepID=UPI0036DCEB12